MSVYKDECMRCGCLLYTVFLEKMVYCTAIQWKKDRTDSSIEKKQNGRCLAEPAGFEANRH